MAISLIAKPYAISPAFNELWFIYDGTNKNNTGYKYIFDVYAAGTATKIAERKVAPRFDDGYGALDLSRLLQGFVDGDFDPTSATTFDATNCYYRYDVKIGEEYVQEVSYTTSIAQNGTYVQISYASQPFSVGDTVSIAQDDGGSANPGLEGLFVVTEANANDFTVNSIWADVTDPTIDGTVKFSDNRKTVTRDIITSTGNLVFNGALSFLNWINYDEADYDLDANTDKFLTALPDEFTIASDQDMWINLLTQTTATGWLYFQNDNGDTYRKTINSGGYIDQALISGDNLQAVLTTISGSGDLVKDDTEYYDVWYANNITTQVSQKYRIFIDRRCRISLYQICFRDRMGSMLSYGFQLREEISGTVKRTKYNQEVEGFVSSSKWNYTTIEKGMKAVDISEDESIVLRTNFIKNQDDLDLFKQLVTSPETYLKLEDGTYISVTVEDTTYTLPKLKNKRLHRKQITVKPSNQDMING